MVALQGPVPKEPMPESAIAIAGRWNLRTLGRSSQIILAVQAVLLLALGALMFHAIATQREARAHVLHEVEAMLTLRTMLEAMIDAETGERGFLLNGESQYLEPLAQARTHYVAARARAERLIARTPYLDELQDLAPLDQRVAAKSSMIEESIALLRAGRRAEAISPERSARGKAAMDSLRAEIARLNAAMEANRQVAIEKAERYEGRLMPLLGLLGAAVVSLVAVSVLLERRHAVVATTAQQASALRAAHGRAELVARELNHRVKNLFAVVLSIVSLTGRSRNADRATMEELRARIHALSIAHSVSQGQVGTERAPLAEIIGRVLAPYASAESGRITLDGPDIDLPVRMVTPVGMIVHELATNAVKYGAFSTLTGTVRIAWHCDENDTDSEKIRLVWIETGGPELNHERGEGMQSGFGATMLELAARQLHGAIERHWETTGARVVLTFPLTG